MRRSRLIFANDGRLMERTVAGSWFRVPGLVRFGSIGQGCDRSQFVEGHGVGVGWYINGPRTRIDLGVDVELLDARGDVDAVVAVSDTHHARETGGVPRVIHVPR